MSKAKHPLNFYHLPSSDPILKPIQFLQAEAQQQKSNTRRDLHQTAITTMDSQTSILSQAEQEKLIDKLEIFKIQGRDKRGHAVLRIIGKFFPAKIVSLEALKKYLDEKIFPGLGERAFSVVYVHSGVNRAENFPGISALKLIYESIPADIKDHLEAVYFLHPDFQSRLFFATFGRFIFSGGLYGKLKYLNRLEYLWDNVRRKEMEMPDFVYDHDEDLEYRPTMDYGMESDHPRVFASPMVDCPVSMYSMRCIS